MKYQDNFHLISFLYKMSKQEKKKEASESRSSSVDHKNIKPKLKIVPPATIKPTIVVKNPPPPVTPETIANLKGSI